MTALENEVLATLFLRSARNLVKALKAMNLEIKNSEYLEKVARRAASLDRYVIFPLRIPNQNGGFRLFLEKNRKPPLVRLIVTKGAVDVQKLKEVFTRLNEQAPEIEVQIREAGHDEAEQPR